jgi:midasin
MKNLAGGNANVAEASVASDSAEIKGKPGDKIAALVAKFAAMKKAAGVSGSSGTASQLVEVESPFQKNKTYVPSAKSDLIRTETTVQNMKKLMKGINLGDNVLMEGPTGAGKTALVKCMAYLSHNELRRINMSDMTDVTEIIGGIKPVRDGKTGEVAMKWVDGIVVEAMRKGQWLLFDELNLANPDILERLNSLFDDDRYLVLAEKPDNERVVPAEGFRIFATQNPASYSGRKEISDAMKNRFHMMWVEGLPPKENVEIMKALSKTSINDDTLLKMAMFNQNIADLAEHKQLGKRDGPYPFTLRDVMKWIGRIERHKGDYGGINQTICNEAVKVYADRFIQKEDKDLVMDTIKAVFGKDAIPPSKKKEIKQVDADHVQIGAAVIDRNPMGGEFVPGDDSKLVLEETGMAQMEKIANCVENDEMVLLVGPTASGKTSYIRYLGNLANTNVRRFNLSQQTDTTDFIGGYVPKAVPTSTKETTLYSGAEGGQAIKTLPAGTEVNFDVIKTVNGEKWCLVRTADGQKGWVKNSDFEGLAKPGEFEWRDGILIEAMKPKTVRDSAMMTKAGAGDSIRTIDAGTKLTYHLTKDINGEKWSFVECPDGQQGWVKDKDIKADWIIFDEINLAEPSILERINSLLDDDRSLVLTERGNERIQAHPSFKTFGTMNPATANYGGRKELSPAMRNRFSQIWHDELKDPAEIKTIVNFFVKKVPESEKMASRMVDFQTEVKDSILKKSIGAKKRGGYVFTLRNLKSWGKYLKKMQGDTFENQVTKGVQTYMQTQNPSMDADAVKKAARKMVMTATNSLGQNETFWDKCQDKMGADLKKMGLNVETLKTETLKQLFIDGAMYVYADSMSDSNDRKAIEDLATKH